MSSSAEMQLAYAVANAPIRHFPFPHLYVRDVFPADFYRRLREHLPSKEFFSTLKALNRVAGDYPDTRLVLPLEPEYLQRLGEPHRSFWLETAAWLLGGNFAGLILSKFAEHLNERFGDAREQQFFNEALLVQDYSTYSLAPHTDSPKKVLSFLFYLPPDDALSHLGTSLYLPKNRRHVSDGTDHHRPEFFDKLMTMPFLPNTLFAFLKTWNSFHGVEPVLERDVRRDLLLYDIKLQNATEPAAPAPTASNVQFKF